MVDIGGYRLHLLCLGRGSPTVVLDSGLGGSANSWSRVQPSVARTTRVCSYDRGGLGWSDSVPFPRTSARLAAELHALLRRAAEQPPYVLVGQSFGGYNVRLFAARYRSEVAGMVLVDASHEDQFSRLPGADAWDRAESQLLSLCRLVVPIGLIRLALIVGLIPRAASSIERSRACTSQYGEIVSMPESAREVRMSHRSLGALPLMVLSRDIPSGLPPNRLAVEHIWRQLQNEQARLSTLSRHIIVRGSGHVIQRDRPRAVVAAIRQVVAASRNHGRWP